MHQTTSDRFGQTDYNNSENQDRPAFQKGGHNAGEMEEDEEMARDAMRQQLQAEVEGANGMFSFENDQGKLVGGVKDPNAPKDKMGHL